MACQDLLEIFYLLCIARFVYILGLHRLCSELWDDGSVRYKLDLSPRESKKEKACGQTKCAEKESMPHKS